MRCSVLGLAPLTAIIKCGLGLDTADLSHAGGFQPSINGLRQRTPLSRTCVDCKMADKPIAYLVTKNSECCLDLKAAGVDSFWLQGEAKLISSMHGSHKVCFAMNHG